MNTTIFLIHHLSDHPASSTYSPHFPRWEDMRARRKISEVGHLLLSRRIIPQTTVTSHVERQKGKDEDSGVRVLKEHLGDLSASERENDERFDLSLLVGIIRE